MVTVIMIEGRCLVWNRRSADLERDETYARF